MSKQLVKLKELIAALTGAKYPVRNVTQNVNDMKAQIAANEKGVQELRKMVAQFGLPVVQAYMQHVQDNAEESVRRAIERLKLLHGLEAQGRGGVVQAEHIGGEVHDHRAAGRAEQLGMGRIDIATKPGAGSWRGNLNYNLGSDIWNSRNPYSATKAPLLLNGS